MTDNTLKIVRGGYSAPVIETVDMQVEQGFAASPTPGDPGLPGSDPTETDGGAW